MQDNFFWWRMKRKVIQIAESTQLISLPRKWCLEHSIKKGAELEVEEQGSRIIVSTAGEAPLQRAALKMSTKEKFLRRPIKSLYILGIDELTIEFDDPAVLSLIQEETKELVGFEVVSHTQYGCVIKSVVSAVDNEFDNILRRILLLLVETARDSLSAIQSKNYAALDEIEQREEINNKLTAFCLRILNKRGYHDHHKLTAMYGLVCMLEYVGDEFKYLTRALKNIKEPLRKEIIEKYQEACMLMQKFYDITYKFTVDSLYEFKMLRVKINDEGLALLRKSKGVDNEILHYAIRIAEKLHHGTVFISA